MTHKIHKRSQQETDEELRRRKRANFQHVRTLGQQFNYIAGPSQVPSAAVTNGAGATPGGGDAGAVGTSV